MTQFLAAAGVARSTEIVGVGLDLELDRWGEDDVVLQAVFSAVGDGRVLGLEGQAYLRAGIARAVPAGQRVGSKRLLALEFQEPAPGIGLARLGRPAFDFGDAGNRHGCDVAKCERRINALSCARWPMMW